MSEFSMDVLDQLSSPSEVVKNLEDILPKLLATFKSDSCNSSFLQIITTLFKDVLAEIKIEEIEKRLLQHVLPCVGEIFSQSLTSVCNTIESVEENEEVEIAATLSQLLQVCLDALCGYNELLEYITTQKNEIKLDFIASLHKTLPHVLLQAFTHCKESEVNYGPYFAVSTEVLTSFFRKSYEIHMKYFKALEDKLCFNCTFEEDVTVLTQVLDTVIAIIEIVTCLDIKTAAEQWKSYVKISNKYSEHIKDRLDLMRPLSLLGSNIHQIINAVTTDVNVLDVKTRTRQLKLGSFILKIYIKLCELHKGYLDDCLPQILDVLLLLYSCSKNMKNEMLINRELDTYICVGGAALLSQFFEDKNFLKEVHKFYIRRMEFPDDQLGLFFIILAIMKKYINTQNKTMQNNCKRYPFLEMILNLYSEVVFQINMNFQMDGKDLHTNIVSTIMAFILSTVTVESYSQFEKLLFENLFSMKIHTSVLISDLLCLLARFTTESLCLEMVQYLCETLIAWPGHYNKDRPEYIVACATLTRLGRLLTDKSCTIISEKYCSDYTSDVSYLLARCVLRKNALTVALPNITILKEDFNIFVNKLMFASIKRSIEDKSESEQLCRLCIACFNTVSKVNNLSELGSTWIQVLACHFLTFLPSLLLYLTNLEILQILNSVEDAIKHGNSSFKFSSVRFLRNIAKHKFHQDSCTNQMFKKIADLFAELLNDNDHLMQQEALDSYSYFAQISSNEEIISLVLNHSKELQESLVLFLQKKVTIQAKNHYFILSNKQRYYHKCIKKTQFFDELECPPSKKLKQNENEDILEKSLSNLFKEVKHLKESIKCEIIPEHCKTLFGDIAKEIEEIKIILCENEMVKELE